MRRRREALHQRGGAPVRHVTHLAVVVLLPLVSQNGADDVAGVFDHHLSGLDVPLAEEAAAVDGRPEGSKAVHTHTHTYIYIYTYTHRYTYIYRVRLYIDIYS